MDDKCHPAVRLAPLKTAANGFTDLPNAPHIHAMHFDHERALRAAICRRLTGHAAAAASPIVPTELSSQFERT
jgi:hypothetical protein